MDDYDLIFFIFYAGMIVVILTILNIRQLQLDDNNGIIKHDFVNEVVARERE